MSLGDSYQVLESELITNHLKELRYRTRQEHRIEGKRQAARRPVSSPLAEEEHMSIRNMSEHGFGGRTPSHNLKFPTQRPFYQLLSLVLSISALGGTLILTSAAATVPRQVSAPAFVPRGANMIGTGAVMFGSSTLGQVIATASDPSMPVEVSVSQPISVQLPSGPGLAVNVMVAAGNRSGLLAPATQFNNRNCGYDGSYSVYECLTMYYNIKNGATYFYGDVEQYSDVVINEDPTSVVLSNLTMQAGVAGTDCNGGGSNGGQTQPWNLGTTRVHLGLVATSGSSMHST
jgi:hypothetical protein